jgi:hypothetical protein
VATVVGPVVAVLQIVAVKPFDADAVTAVQEATGVEAEIVFVPQVVRV